MYLLSRATSARSSMSPSHTLSAVKPVRASEKNSTPARFCMCVGVGVGVRVWVRACVMCDVCLTLSAVKPV